MTTTITLEKAQQELPLLVKRALAGEDIVIEAAGEAAIRLAPIEPAAERTAIPGTSYRGRGALKGQLIVGPEFFEPLSDEECGIDRNEPGNQRSVFCRVRRRHRLVGRRKARPTASGMIGP